MLLTPRLNNRLEAVFVKSDANKTESKFLSLIAELQITLPNKLTVPAVVVSETMEITDVATKPSIVSPTVNRKVLLTKHESVTHGELVWY